MLLLLLIGRRGRSIRIVCVERIQLVFLVVEVVVHQPEDDTGNERSASQTHEHPHDGRVIGSGGQCLGQSGTEGVGEQVHGLHERLHRRRSLGVGILQSRHRRENLRQTNEDIGRRLDSNVHVVAGGGPINLRRSTSGVLVAWPSGVNEVLNNGGVHHGQGGNNETQGDTGNRTETDAQATQQGVDKGLQDGNEDNDGDRIKVLHQVVRDSVTLHLAGLGDKVAGELTVNDPVDRVETEHTASNQRTLELVNEVVVPGHVGPGTVVGRLPAGLGSIHVAVDNHDPQRLEGVGDNGALGRANDVVLAAEDEHHGTDSEHAQAKQITGPEANVLLHVRSGQQRQRSHVDTAVEDHINALNRKGRVNDNTLALLGGGHGHLLALVLVGNQRSNVTLDTASSQTDDQDRHNEATNTGSMVKSRGDGRANQDEESDQVNDTENHDGLVFTEVLISDDGTDDGGNFEQMSVHDPKPFMQ